MARLSSHARSDVGSAYYIVSRGSTLPSSNAVAHSELCRPHSYVERPDSDCGVGRLLVLDVIMWLLFPNRERKLYPEATQRQTCGKCLRAGLLPGPRRQCVSFMA